MDRPRVASPRYDHLLGLIDDTGVLEHARFGVPRREHGYTTDDAARASIVLCRGPAREDIDAAALKMLSFVIHAVGPGGSARNRLGYDRRWKDAPHFGDHHGRVVWALGVAATAARWPEWRQAAADVFAGVAPPEGHYLRPHALAALGAAEIWVEKPGDEVASGIFDRAIEALGGSSGGWPEDRLTYDNGRIPHALLRMGGVLNHPDLVQRGLELLTWLHGVERANGHYSFTPVGGWSSGESRPGFDQQPIEAAAMAEAALCAWRVTGDGDWADAVAEAERWLNGRNDVGAVLIDGETGACYDGLTAHGVNANRGAESTIAALSVLQTCLQIGHRDHEIPSLHEPLPAP